MLPEVPVLTKGSAMFITRGESEFEVSISMVDGEWEGKIVENTLSHVVPIVHLCHNWTSHDAAVAGVRRRWQRLFPDEPDEDRPDFHEALNESMPSSDASHHL
jgi:hypothetical protein